MLRFILKEPAFRIDSNSSHVSARRRRTQAHENGANPFEKAKIDEIAKKQGITEKEAFRQVLSGDLEETKTAKREFRKIQRAAKARRSRKKRNQ